MVLIRNSADKDKSALLFLGKTSVSGPHLIGGIATGFAVYRKHLSTLRFDEP
jgi:hypothetical protein